MQHEVFKLFAQNAKFESLRGFFNADVALDDTMTPIQREFVRPAQIFKSRVIVEMEMNQRISELAMTEERFGNDRATAAANTWRAPIAPPWTPADRSTTSCCSTYSRRHGRQIHRPPRRHPSRHCQYRHV